MQSAGSPEGPRKARTSLPEKRHSRIHHEKGSGESSSTSGGGDGGSGGGGGGDGGGGEDPSDDESLPAVPHRDQAFSDSGSDDEEHDEPI